MSREISNSDDLIDVRDVIERFEELEQEMQFSVQGIESEEITSGVTGDDMTDIAEEFSRLQALLSDLKDKGGDEQWKGAWYPVSLIRDNYFETAMDELLEDIGDLPKDLPSYLTITVDYDMLQMDYSSVEFDGVTYWYR